MGVWSDSLDQLGNLSLSLSVLRAVGFALCCLLGSTPRKLRRNFTLRLQLISFSITKTFHGWSQLSLICEANKPSNNKNLLKRWYSSLLFLSVNVQHGKLMCSFWLGSYVAGCQGRSISWRPGVPLWMCFCSAVVRWPLNGRRCVSQNKFFSCEHISPSVNEL